MPVSPTASITSLTGKDHYILLELEQGLHTRNEAYVPSK